MSDDYTRAGGSYYTEGLREILSKIYVDEGEALAQAVERGQAAEMPQIQISPLDGQLLMVLMKLVKAKKVVEVGTLAGYSGLWIIQGMGEGGHLHTIEYNPEHAKVAKGVFASAGVSSQVDVHVGAGLDVLPSLESEGPFDVVFMDADKKGMPDYLEWAKKNLRPGGLVLADNSFLFGYLADRTPEDPEYQETIDAVFRFHRNLARDFDAIPLPTPQGLALGIQRG